MSGGFCHHCPAGVGPVLFCSRPTLIPKDTKAVTAAGPSSHERLKEWVGLGLWFVAMEMPLWWWWEGKASSSSFPLSVQLPFAQLVVIADTSHLHCRSLGSCRRSDGVSFFK